jgi:MoaA/NifB/PqqE/SkfB family radical SAM enzyme
MRELSQRGDIRLGYRCNARCGFCYYQALLDNPVEKEPTTAQLRARLLALRTEGATEVEFTGGEPTIRPDLPELVGYTRELGFANISVISNGLRLANSVYAKRLVEAGVNDFLFSVHGPNPEIHDAHTSVPGSFAKIMKAIGNVGSLGARCRSTTTVTGQNYSHIESMLELFLELSIECIHFAVFSPVADAADTDKRLFVSYAHAAASIKRAIDRFEDRLPPLSVKYIPFCLMRGYEKYVMNLYQQNYDPDDWNYYYSNKVRRADNALKRVAFDAASLAGSLLAKDWSIPMRHGWYGLRVFGFTRLVELLRKKRLPACRDCAYDIVCDHVWKDYVKHFGSAEVSPVPGPKVKDPAWVYVMARYRDPGVRLGGAGSRSDTITSRQTTQLDDG